VFGLTSEISVVGAPVSLTMGCHGPSADLFDPECVYKSTLCFETFTCPMRTPFSRFCRDPPYGGS